MKKPGLFILLTVFVFLQGWTQTSRKNKSHELSIYSGGCYYIGELNPNKHLGNNAQLAGGVAYRNNVNRRIGFRGSVLYGSAQYWDKNSSDPWQQNRNLNFKNQFYEFGFITEINYFDYQLNSKDRISPYLFTGIAYYRMNPQGFSQGNWIPLQTLGTEGQWSNSGNQYKLAGLSVPFGLGLKMNMFGFMGISFEWGIRKTWTDYFDDVSTVYTNPKEQMHQQGQLSLSLSDQSIEQFRPDSSSPNDPSKRNNEGMMRGDPSNHDFYGYGLIALNFRLDKPATNCFK
jgi:Domain of unknown function (DUF6089)